MLSSMARTKAALPFDSAQSNMVEVHLLLLWTMVTILFSDTQWLYVAIKHVIALCSQTPFKCTIARPLKRVRTICASEHKTTVFKESAVFTPKVESENLLKEAHLCFPSANRVRSCGKLFLCLESLFKFSKVLHGFSRQHWCQFVGEGCLLIFWQPRMLK